MIPIQLQPEPPHFFMRVQKPGQDFLKSKPNPTARDWNSHNYWIRVADDLYKTYAGICAYSCHWIPPDTGAITVPFPFSHLEKKAPFLANELKRQNLTETIHEIMRF